MRHSFFILFTVHTYVHACLQSMEYAVVWLNTYKAVHGQPNLINIVHIQIIIVNGDSLKWDGMFREEG